ncbi:MAG: hypothetical protein JWL95_735 [Gemmatimonadetes bacterium]|nr:hypothetical protein [Gemmatimonadota bacterium]
MRSGRTTPHVTRARRGFSIVEVLVALVLVTVGLLGVAGNCALAIRVAGSAARERRAVQRAANRIATLRSRGCASAIGTWSDAGDTLSERWTVAPARNGVALVDAEVRWTTPAGTRSELLRDAFLC